MPATAIEKALSIQRAEPSPNRPKLTPRFSTHDPGLGQLVEDDDDEGEAEGGVGDAWDFHSGR
jgi:hypothetical protein